MWANSGLTQAVIHTNTLEGFGWLYLAKKVLHHIHIVPKNEAFSYIYINHINATDLACFYICCVCSISVRSSLDLCISAVVGEGLVRDTMSHSGRGPPLDHRVPGLVLSHNDRAPGRQRGVLVEEVEGAQEEAHGVPRRGGVWDVL